MPRDHSETIRALRAKAKDRAVTPEEARALDAKADELEAKYGKVSSPITDDTILTSRDGWVWAKPHAATTVPPTKEAWEEVWKLFHNQWQWNKPPAEEEDIVEERFREEPEDEDAGYDIYEGEDW